MAPPEGVETFAGRLSTFEGPHQVAKRRASSTKKKSPTTVSWPHKSPTPDELAKAGFYYNPSAATEDSVTCFICHKSLDGWDVNDNPALEHLAHVPDCGWAINICIEQRMQHNDRAEEDPMSDRMMEARQATFRDAWPHEQKKGWKCKEKKMIEAGWCYNPVPEADDCVQCFYCGVSLDGWEPKDDPRAEHQRRAPECHFFTLVEESAKLQKLSKTKKGRTSRTAKESRLSTQSSTTITSEAPSFTSIDNTVADEGDTIMSTATTSSKGGRKQPAKRKAAPKTTRRGPKSKKLHEENLEIAAVQTEIEADNEVGEDTTLLSTGAKKPRSKRPDKRAQSEAQDNDIVVPDEDLPESNRSQTKPRKRATKKARGESETGIDMQSQTQANANRSQQEDGAKPKRGIKRTSNGTEKPHETALGAGPSKSKAPSKRAKSNLTELKGNRASERLDPEPPSGGAESSLGKKGLVDSSGSPRLDDETVEVQEPQIQLERRAGLSQSQTTILQRTAVAAEPKKPKQNSNIKASSPSSSPQSSDAENRAPSSRPSFNAEMDVADNHQDAVQIVTPTKSPSKRNIIAGGLQTSFPWDAVDLEMAFLQSPNSRPEGKEHLGVEEVLRQMTSPERSMTVEQWIKWNAQGAEDRLRQDCERLVGVFEIEGVKALRAVEGIECI